MLGFGYSLMVSWFFLFVCLFVCFTSSVSLTGSYTEDEPLLQRVARELNNVKLRVIYTDKLRGKETKASEAY